MIPVLDGPDKKPVLFVGNDADDTTAEEKGYAILRACKDGPYGHRSMLGYKSLGAPKGDDYYFVQKGDKMALNLIDADDPGFIPKPAIEAGLGFIDEQLRSGKKVLVHCNHGKSRGPTMALMYMRQVGQVSNRFGNAMKEFHSLYHEYDPNRGMLTYMKNHWDSLRA
jgi:hypothetical protein